jgi:hypothetical protein
LIAALDQIIQMQLDEHAARIKKFKTAVFSKSSSRLAYQHRSSRHHPLHRRLQFGHRRTSMRTVIIQAANKIPDLK